MPNDTSTQTMTSAVDTVEGGLNVVTIAMVVIQFYSDKIFKQMVAALLSLQIICHQGILNVKFPANTASVVRQLK